MGDQGAFDLGRAHAVARDIDDVVHPAGDPVIPVLVAPAAIAREISAGIGGEIGLEEALVVAPHGAHLAGPAVRQAQIAFTCAVQLSAFGIHDDGSYSGQRQGRAARFQVGRARQGRNQRPTCFGLPPGIHDRTAALADHAVIPFPGFGIDRLTHRAEQSDRPARRPPDPLVSLAHQRAQRGGCGIEDRHVPAVAHLPEARKVRVVRHALEHQGGRPVRQRSIDHIGVARDPADVSGAPEDLWSVVIEHHLVGQRRPHQISARGVKHALGLACRARGIQDEQRILGPHRLRRTIGGNRLARIMIPDVATVLHRHRMVRVADHHHAPHRGSIGQRGIDIGLQRHMPAPAEPAVGRHHHCRVAVLYAPAKAFGRKAAKHHRMDRPDPRACQHGHGCLGDHRHIDRDPVAAPHALRLQHVGEPADLGVQLAIADTAGP